jgi:hypothetical protein
VVRQLLCLPRSLIFPVAQAERRRERIRMTAPENEPSSDLRRRVLSGVHGVWGTPLIRPQAPGDDRPILLSGISGSLVRVITR